MQFPRLDRKKIQRYVTFEGIEHVQQALALGKGAIILTGHFGNWELLAAGISSWQLLRSHRLFVNCVPPV